MKNEIIQLCLNADLRCSHDGLSDMLKKNFKIDTMKLDAGEYVVCVNSAKTIVKIFTGGNVIAHYKSPHGMIDLRTLKSIPKFFNGRSFNYEGALGDTIRKEIRERLEKSRGKTN